MTFLCLIELGLAATASFRHDRAACTSSWHPKEFHVCSDLTVQFNSPAGCSSVEQRMNVVFGCLGVSEILSVLRLFNVILVNIPASREKVPAGNMRITTEQLC